MKKRIGYKAFCAQMFSTQKACYVQPLHDSGQLVSATCVTVFDGKARAVWVAGIGIVWERKS